MAPKSLLGLADYAVILSSLVISSLIGLGFRFTSGRQKTINEYLLAGKDSYLLPVVMSATVTMISGIALTGTPAEVYRYGPQFIVMPIFTMVGMLLASRICLPVYFRCGVTSIYEYLEMRFGKFTRYTISIIFMIQLMLYMSVVLYAPVLVLSAVTEFPTEITIVVCGCVCTFYCVLGGLKAVLWTDVFQCILMFLCVIIIFTVGIKEAEGVGEIYRLSSEGKRLQIFDMSFDFTTRYTFWNCIFRGLSYGFGCSGCNQIEVQRLLSVSGCKRAQRALQWSTIPLGILISLTCLFGLVLYAVFHLCDPVLLHEETGITKYDQMVPYFIITRMKSIPGLTGLCIAGIFSGSLSTTSSALNSLATVTVVDFIQPIMGNRLTDTKLVFIAKAFSLLFGIICILFAFALTSSDSIQLVCIVLISLAEGTVLAIFLIGVLTRKVSDKCATAGLIVGLVLISWIGFGSMFGGFRYPSLPLETSGCSLPLNETSNVFLNSSMDSSLAAKSSADKDIFILYKVSFCWIGTLGSVFTFIATFFISLLTDRNKNMIPSDSKCLSPVVRYWMKWDSSKKDLNKIQVDETELCD